MPFIGQQPITGAYHKLDSITTSATATYNLQLNGGAYYPTSANHLLVSLNGVMQAPQDSFTVSGSQITFASALTSSDSIDFIMALGDVLNIGTPSDGTVNTNQLVNNAVTMDKLATSGTLPALDGSALTGISAGKVLQVESTYYQTVYAQNHSSWTNVTNFDVSITPSSTSNKILVMCHIVAGGDNWYGFRVMRNGSVVVNGGDTGSLGSRQDASFGSMQIYSWSTERTEVQYFHVLESPSTTSTLTYQVQAVARYGSTANNVYINRPHTWNNDSISGRITASNITVMEIEG